MRRISKALNCAVIVLFLSLALAISVNADDSIAEYESYCEEIGDQYGICPELLESMCYYESGWNPNVVSSCGAIGLMQIRPEFNEERMDRLGITDLTDPYQNILCGADIISDLAQRYEVYDALVAYNAGEYSNKLEEVRSGGSSAYADKILEYSAQLEREHGK